MWIAIDQDIQAPRVQAGALRATGWWIVPMRIPLRPNASDPRFEDARRALMVEVPVPASMEVSEASFWELSQHPSVRHAELNTAGPRPILGLFLDTINAPLTFDVEFKAPGPLDVAIGAAHVLP